MIPYLFAYGSSLFFIFLSTREKRTKTLMIGSIVFAVLIICIFSGLRGFNVGRDINLYGVQVFKGAVSSSNFSDFKHFVSGGEKIEIGYLFFNFIISRFTSSMSIFLFVHAVLVNGLSIIAFFKLRNYFSISFMWFSYLMLVYPYTLTMLRQSIAQALIFFAVVLLLTSKRKIISLLVVLSSLLMHNSAYFGLIIFIIAYLFKIQKMGKKTVVASLIIAFFLSLSSRELIPTMISNGYLSSKYDMYDGSYSSASLLNPLLVRIPFIFLLYFSWWKDKIKSQNFLFRSFAYFVILEFIIQPIKLFDYNVARVIWYLNYFLGIGYIMTVGTISIGKIKFAKSFSLIIVVAVLLYIGFYSNIYEQKVNMKGLGLYPYAFWNSY